MKIAVMGAGSWGSAMAKVFVDAGSSVTIWARRPEVADEIDSVGTNSRYLAGIDLRRNADEPNMLRAVSDPRSALSAADVVALAVPSQTLRENLRDWAAFIPPRAAFLSLAKGIETSTLLRMTQVIEEVTRRPSDQIGTLTGPNLAREVALELPTSSVIAFGDAGLASDVQKSSATGYFLTDVSDDVVGCEIGGVVKNVIALACGIATGLGGGENTVATIITRGLAETIQLAQKMGARMDTLTGMAGLGDLIATCGSERSRNRMFGHHMGSGLSVEDATLETGQVAEGVQSCRSVRVLAEKFRVAMPLTEAVYDVCHLGLPPAMAIRRVLGQL